MTAAPVGDDIAYDPTSGAFTLTEAGTYLAMWDMLLSVNNVPSGNIVVALESADGNTRYALSGVTTATSTQTGVVSGSAVFTAQAGDTIVLRNRSGRAIRFSIAAGGNDSYSANVTVVRLA